MSRNSSDFSGLFGEPTPHPAAAYYESSGPSAPFGWFGGKAYYAQWILSHFPDHEVYVEPFGGAGNVLLRKRPSAVEIFNDLDHRLINFFRVLRDRAQFDELVRLATLTPYSRAEFAVLAEAQEPVDLVQKAWWFFVRCRQALGGSGMTRLLPCFWAMSTRSRRGMAEPVSKYLSAIDGLEEIATRFRTVAIECLDANDLIAKYDGENVLLYCDPPYVPETRHPKAGTRYGKEMTLGDHKRLLGTISKAKSKVIISGYDCELYSDVLAGWSRVTTTGKAHMSNSGQTRVEVLWMNW